MIQSNQESSTTYPPREFVARRNHVLNSLSLSKVVLDIAQILSSWRGASPLCYADTLPYRIELDEESISSYINSVDEMVASGIPKIFVLSDHPTRPRIQLFLRKYEFYRDECEDFLEIHFPLPDERFSVSNRDLQSLQIDRFAEVASQVCCAFNANIGWVRDYCLSPLHGRALREYYYELSKIPIEEHQYVPMPQLPPGVEEDVLPELLCLDEFDYLRVPNGVSWVNYWSHEIVERIGLEKIDRAPWKRKIQLENGAILLVSTDLPTDVRNLEHIAKLSDIVQTLELRDLQEHYKLSNNIH